MTPDKGAHRAIRVARRAGLPIKVAGPIRSPDEEVYLERFVAPELGPDVTWLGELGAPEKFEVLGEARALLFPIDWAEPFGLVMAEALACGTPVIASPMGSVGDMIEDGVTGFVRPDEREMAKALELVARIDRRRCRDRAEERFSVAAMVDDYERVIARVAARA